MTQVWPEDDAPSDDDYDAERRYGTPDWEEWDDEEIADNWGEEASYP